MRRIGWTYLYSPASYITVTASQPLSCSNDYTIVFMSPLGSHSSFFGRFELPERVYTVILSTRRAKTEAKLLMDEGPYPDDVSPVCIWCEVE